MPAYDIVVDASIADLSASAATAALAAAAAVVPIAGRILALFNDAYWDAIKRSIVEHQVDGKVCIRMKEWSVVLVPHVALEISAPNTATYKPSGGNDPYSF